MAQSTTNTKRLYIGALPEPVYQEVLKKYQSVPGYDRPIQGLGNELYLASCRALEEASEWHVHAFVMPAQRLIFADDRFTHSFTNFDLKYEVEAGGFTEISMHNKDLIPIFQHKRQQAQLAWSSLSLLPSELTCNDGD